MVLLLTKLTNLKFKQETLMETVTTAKKNRFCVQLFLRSQQRQFLRTLMNKLKLRGKRLPLMDSI